jgi:uroporphyrinogen decarboxylase
MHHLHRIEYALEGKETDRPAFGFWRHFPNEDRSPRRLAELMIALQKELDLDFIKVMPYGLFSVVDWGVKLKVFEGYLEPPVQGDLPIMQAEDWTRLGHLPGDSGEYAVVLESQRILLSDLKEPVPIVQTVFSPLTSAVKMAGEQTLITHINENPESVHAGLDIITETTRQFAFEAVSRGADGVFFATQMSNVGQLTSSQHADFVRTYDLRVLEAIAKKSWFNILHLHGPRVMIDEFLDYPVQALNWHDRDDGPSLSEVRKKTSKCLIGGLAHKGALLRGSPTEAAAQAEDAWCQLQGRGLIIGPGCGDQTRIPRANLLQVKKTIMAING